MEAVAAMPHAAAAAVGVGGAGLWLFDYNRENYQYDAGMRFTRFTAARNFAISQMNQYREDVHGLTEMTSAKMDVMYTVCTLFMAVCAALSCAGRIGMHGCAPPGWLCALYSGHIFTAIMYLTLSMWLALHASLRAQCAATSLLTRKVRLPIPSTGQLDGARLFGSGFEQMRWHDIFRTPWMKHPERAPDLPVQSDDDEKDGKAKGKKDMYGNSIKQKLSKANPDKSPGFDSTTRATIPSWIRDEQVVDKGGGMTHDNFVYDPDELPKHFKLYAQAQQEWWPFDVYARVNMLLGVMQFLFAVSYYSIGTTMSELRGFWISWSLPMVFLVAQVLILKLDVFQYKGQHMLPHMEWAGHLAPYLAITATTLEYRWTYTSASVTVTWGFVIAAFFGHFMFALRMLDLAWPYHFLETDMPEKPGRAWWPASWRLPPSFTKALWIIAPPKKLERDVSSCLMNEAEALKRSGAAITSANCRRRKRGAKGPTRGRTPPTLAGLQAQIGNLEGLFQSLGQQGMQLTERQQQRLTDMQRSFAIQRAQVDRLAEGGYSSNGAQSPRTGRQEAGSDDDGKNGGDNSEVAMLAEALGDIEQTLTDMETHIKAATKASTSAATRINGTSEGAYAGASVFSNFDKKGSPDLPWNLTRTAIATVAICWLWMIVASVIELILGPESLLKPPGEPPWIRDQKYRHWSPAMIHLSNQPTPADYRLFNPMTANYMDGSEAATASHTTVPHRLLSELNETEKMSMALADLVKELPSLGWLAGALQRTDMEESWPPIAAVGDIASSSPENPATQDPASFMAPAVAALNVAWPSFFEPRHILCSPHASSKAVVALTKRGFGAISKLPDSPEEEASMAPFALEGISVGPLAGASWLKTGLQLVTKSGKVLHCEGHAPQETGWPCEEARGPKLPIPHGSHLTAAAISQFHDDADWKSVAAIMFEGLPGRVTLLGDDGSGKWSTIGEVHVPNSHGQKNDLGLSFDRDELLMITSNGEIHRRRIRDGSSALHAAPAGSSLREWRAACAMPSGQLMRLASRRSDSELGSASLPELIGA
mmetsp:Transcript_764/g.1842  ORF Transcript_764/g.1842 Transcript_764/m.1842 type:complete len:1050 (-) Transcript_764:240-3389(-)|eukprot:CAMPEP_0170602884 /NCGR_PEP_ID=MMETSP0224-20130122/18626_1 /TAXON_ID=285029 /ORGANISM="Togula jolla, Strain CCCM 725" /LENGTH=1049 /DNA_ID=CAMNT_0010927747 /DNA_START=79 /DNA_END=3228 /DNA_ORIENTATION=-